MKKMAFAILVSLLSLNPCMVFAANTFIQDAREAENFTAKIQEFSDTMKIVMDYEARTDDNPVYLGKAIRGKATTDDAWIIYYFTYDGDGQILSRTCAFGAWTDRATLTYE